MNKRSVSPILCGLSLSLSMSLSPLLSLIKVALVIKMALMAEFCSAETSQCLACAFMSTALFSTYCTLSPSLHLSTLEMWQEEEVEEEKVVVVVWNHPDKSSTHYFLVPSHPVPSHLISLCCVSVCIKHTETDKQIDRQTDS